MEKRSASTLPIKNMSDVAEEARAYIQARYTGEEKSLLTSSPRINQAFMNGFDWNRIITIGGVSGAGKSTIARQWIKDFVELNKTEDFDVLTFQFEMLGLDEVARDVSSKMGKSIKELYSAEGKLSSKDLKDIDAALDEVKQYPIYVVDNIGSTSNVKDTLLYYISSNKLIERKKGLVVVIDNASLVLPEDGGGEKDTIDKFIHMLVLIKKYVASLGGKIMFFVISQLNRNIESSERVLNPKLHYPNKSDLFGASSVYNSSDYVIVIHRPCLIEGIGNWYGPSKRGFDNGLPVFNPHNPLQPMTYLHIIKERFGQQAIVPMLDDLGNSRIVDFKL